MVDVRRLKVNKPELRIRFISSVFSVTVDEKKKKKKKNNNNNNNKSTPCSRILLEKQLFPRLVQKLPSRDATQGFIIVSTAVGACPYRESGHTLQSFSIRSPLILPWYLRVGLAESLFTQYFSNKIFSGFIICPHAGACYCTRLHPQNDIR